MSKSIYVVGGLGVVGCVVMSMMMQHVLKVNTEQSVPPVVSDIHDLHGSRLSKLCAIAIEEEPDHTKIELTAYPTQELGSRRLAEDLGLFVWRRYAVRQVVDEVVVVIQGPDGEPQRVEVKAPMLARRKLRPRPAADPAPRPGANPAAGAAENPSPGGATVPAPGAPAPSGRD